MNNIEIILSRDEIEKLRDILILTATNRHYPSLNETANKILKMLFPVKISMTIKETESLK
jgi:hypothetical protein